MEFPTTEKLAIKRGKDNGETSSEATNGVCGVPIISGLCDLVCVAVGQPIAVLDGTIIQTFFSPALTTCVPSVFL